MSELSIILIIAFAFGCGFMEGWLIREGDKKRDAKLATDAWLKGLEAYEATELRQIYQSSLEPNKLTRVK